MDSLRSGAGEVSHCASLHCPYRFYQKNVALNLQTSAPHHAAGCRAQCAGGLAGGVYYFGNSPGQHHWIKGRRRNFSAVDRDLEYRSHEQIFADQLPTRSRGDDLATPGHRDSAGRAPGDIRLGQKPADIHQSVAYEFHPERHGRGAEFPAAFGDGGKQFPRVSGAGRQCEPRARSGGPDLGRQLHVAHAGRPEQLHRHGRGGKGGGVVEQSRFHRDAEREFHAGDAGGRSRRPLHHGRIGADSEFDGLRLRKARGDFRDDPAAGAGLSNREAPGGNGEHGVSAAKRDDLGLPYRRAHRGGFKFRFGDLSERWRSAFVHVGLGTLADGWSRPSFQPADADQPHGRGPPGLLHSGQSENQL